MTTRDLTDRLLDIGIDLRVSWRRKKREDGMIVIQAVERLRALEFEVSVLRAGRYLPAPEPLAYEEAPVPCEIILFPTKEGPK